MELKNTIIKSITAVLCVVAICLTAVANTGKICDAKIAGAKPGTTEATGGDVPTGEDVTEAPAGEDTTEAPAGEDATEAPAGEDTTEAPAGDNDKPTSTGTGSTKTTGKTTSSKPSTVADIVACYNKATANAFNKKAPFSKTRTTTEKAYKAGVALNASKDIVYKFMGIGDKYKYTKTVTAEDKDSYQKYLQASKLTANDVTKATCTQSGSNYTITLYVKSGSSSVKGGKVVSSNNSPLDRSGLACGDHDKDYWDHKTAENVISAIAEVPLCGKADIDESYSNAVITAVVNASTGNLVSLKASFNFKFALANVMGTTGNAEALTSISMTGFKF